MREVQKVTDPAKIVTDPVLLNVLAERSIDRDYVEFVQDYAPRSLGKEHSPYAKFYRDLKSNKRFMVVSGLPMVAPDGKKIETGWILQSGYKSRHNLFSAEVQDVQVTTAVLYDQPDGRKAGDKVTYCPQLFLDGSEVQPTSVEASLLPSDPLNPNYAANVLEWDYGICQRRLRIIEGRLLGSWVFPAKPEGEIRIKYNQTGSFKLTLGQFQVSDDEEQIKSADFDRLAKEQGGYPVTISDTAIFYPDADPETSGVDGYVQRYPGDRITWADVRDGAGTAADDTYTLAFAGIWFANQANRYWLIRRGIVLFDTSSLPDGANIASATLNLYGSGEVDDANKDPLINVFSANPAGTTGLVATDYGTLGTTAFSTAKDEAAWNVGAYNTFALNASGIAAISKTGVSKYGVREAKYDAPNNDPAWTGVGNLDSQYNWYTAEQGFGYKPKLVVEYSFLGILVWNGADWVEIEGVLVATYPTPILTELFFNTTFSTQDYTQWVTAAQGVVPATAAKVVIWAGHSTSSANTGRSRGLYNGVEKCVCTSNWQYGYAGRWAGDGLGIAATVACQIREGGLGAYWVYAQVGCYYT